VIDGQMLFRFLRLVNQIHRILCDGALFLSCTPACPSNEAFQDPTHVNIITEDTFSKYLCVEGVGRPWTEIYGFTGEFKLVDQAWLHNAFLLTPGKAVK